MKLDDDWDAPYTSPLRGCFMLGRYGVGVIASVLLLLALLVARAMIPTLFG